MGTRNGVVAHLYLVMKIPAIPHSPPGISNDFPYIYDRKRFVDQQPLLNGNVSDPSVPYMPQVIRFQEKFVAPLPQLERYPDRFKMPFALQRPHFFSVDPENKPVVVGKAQHSFPILLTIEGTPSIHGAARKVGSAQRRVDPREAEVKPASIRRDRADKVFFVCEMGDPVIERNGLDVFGTIKRVPVVAVFVETGHQPLVWGHNRCGFCSWYPIVVSDRFDVIIAGAAAERDRRVECDGVGTEETVDDAILVYSSTPFVVG